MMCAVSVYISLSSLSLSCLFIYFWLWVCCADDSPPCLVYTVLGQTIVGSSAAHTQNNVYYSPLTLFLSVTLVHLCVSHMHTHHVRLSYCYLFLCTVLLFDTDKWKVQVSGVEQCNDSTKQCHQAKLWPSVFYLCSINVTLLLHTLTYSHYTHHSHVHT